MTRSAACVCLLLSVECGMRLHYRVFCVRSPLAAAAKGNGGRFKQSCTTESKTGTVSKHVEITVKAIAMPVLLRLHALIFVFQVIMRPPYLFMWSWKYINSHRRALSLVSLPRNTSYMRRTSLAQSDKQDDILTVQCPPPACSSVQPTRQRFDPSMACGAN